MVKEYGMSDSLGLVAHRQDRSQQYMGMPGMPTPDRSYSDETAKRIDAEISRIIAEGYERAKSILRERREPLEQVVGVLFEKEVMDGDELRLLLRVGSDGGNGSDADKEGARVEEPASDDSIERPQEIQSASTSVADVGTPSDETGTDEETS